MSEAFQYNPPVGGIPVLFEDADVLFVDKPAGLLSVPGRLDAHKDSLLNRLDAIHGEAHLIHRLDMDTSGVMVFAKSKTAQRLISQQFEKRVVKKVYLAEVSGAPKDEGTIDVPLMADWPNRPLQKVDDAGKPSITHWRVLERRQGTSIVELHPETGRSHQLRVHMAHIGHAIVGDRFYAPPHAVDGFNRLNLHAFSLTIAHPLSGKELQVQSPCTFFRRKLDSRAV